MANYPNNLPSIAIDKGKREIQALSPTGHHEAVDGSSASATSTADFYKGQIVRIVAKAAAAHFAFATKTVTSADNYIPANFVEYFFVEVNTKISVLGAVVDITVML